MNDIARAPGSSTSVFIHERNVTVKLMKLITELYIKGLCSPPGFTCKIVCAYHNLYVLRGFSECVSITRYIKECTKH